MTVFLVSVASQQLPGHDSPESESEKPDIRNSSGATFSVLYSVALDTQTLQHSHTQKAGPPPVTLAPSLFLAICSVGWDGSFSQDSFILALADPLRWQMLLWRGPYRREGTIEARRLRAPHACCIRHARCADAPLLTWHRRPLSATLADGGKTQGEGSFSSPSAAPLFIGAILLIGHTNGKLGTLAKECGVSPHFVRRPCLNPHPSPRQRLTINCEFRLLVNSRVEGTHLV